MLEAIIAAGVPLGLAIIGFLMKLSSKLTEIHTDLKSVTKLVERHETLVTRHESDIKVLQTIRHLSIVGNDDNN